MRRRGEYEPRRSFPILPKAVTKPRRRRPSSHDSYDAADTRAIRGVDSPRVMILLPQLHGPAPGGGCGECTACCDVIGVDAVGKPYYARCPHLDPGKIGAACAVYADRPRTCL